VRDNLGIRRRRALIALLPALLALAIGSPAVRADDGGMRLSIDNLALNSDFLSFDLNLEGAFGQGQGDELFKGFATNIAYTVELWKERGLWFDKLQLTRTLTLKVTYDLWAERYVVHFRRDRMARFDTIEEVENATCRLQGLKLVEATELSPDDEYYIAVRARVRPLTVEELGEIESWLSGDVPSTGGGGILSLPTYLMKMLLGTTGVADRSVLAKSDVFTITQGPEADQPPE
jgi:hypothetical protein